MSEWTTIRTVTSQTEAELIRGALDAGEIPAVIRRENVGGEMPQLEHQLGVAVMVPQELLAEAEALLKALQEGP